jgi:hypothetical protein
MRKFWILALFLGSVVAVAQNCALPVGFSASQFNTANTAAVNNTCTGTASGRTVLWPAGTTTIASGGLSIACSNNASSPVVIMGPVDANPSSLHFVHPTAIASTTAVGSGDALNIASGCVGLTVHGIKIVGSGGFSINGASSYITLTGNEYNGIPDSLNSSGRCCNGPSGVDVNGSLASGTSTANGQTVMQTYDHDINVTNSIMGDSTSCPNAAAGTGGADNDGCEGMHVGIGEAQNFTISGNYIFHVNEGIHFAQLQTSFNGSLQDGVGDNVVISDNYLTTIYRNPVEYQVSTVNHPFLFQHNAFYGVNQHFSGEQIGFTIPCCQTGFYENAGTVNPAVIESDNTFVTIGSANQENFGFEFWGNGPINQYNLVEGQVANNVTYGYWGAVVGTVQYDYLCWSAGYTTGTGFITNEEKQTAPTEIGNVTSTSCSSTTSVAPTISPASGAVSFPLTVTMAVPTTTTNYNTGQNTSIYYTTDGSTPVPGSGTTQLYTAPVVLTSASTIKAIGMWGTGPEPLSWPSGYGYTPSLPQSVTYTGGGVPTAATPTFSPASETFTGSVSVSISSTTSGAAIRYTTDGTTPTSGSTLYSGPLTISATTTVEAIAIESGYANSAVGTATYTLAGTPTITSGYQGNTGSINTLAVGAPGFNQVAYGVYSDGNTRTEPDAYGNTPSWSSSDTTILSVSPYVNSSNTGGAISCVAIGTASIKVSAGGVIFSTWGMTCTAATKTLTSIAISATGGATLTVGATNQTVLLCTYSDSSTDNCSTQVVVNTANIDDTLTNWKPVCVLPSCNPGGSNPPASTSQTINNPTPSLDGESMLLSSTTSASSTQTNALWVYNSPTTCDACTDFVMYTPFYLSGATSYITSPEFDLNDFIHTGLIQITFASQCDLVGAHWQINNGFGSWVNTIVTCNPSFNAWHYATLVGHRNIGDTSCGGYPTLYFVSLTVDGTVHTLNQTLCAGALPATYASGILPQYQIDIGATTSAQTATMNIDKVYATASIPSTAATVNYATTDATKVSVNSSGLVTGVATGSAGITATSGTVTSNTLTYTVSNTLTLNSITLANVDGITALAVGQTEKFVATCNYSNSTALTCSQSADANGNLVSFNNSNVGAGTITNPQGIFTGTGAQTTNLTAVAAGVTSNTINFTVFPALPITFKLTGLQMQFNGNTITLGYK